MKKTCWKHRFFYKLKHAKGIFFHIAGIICFLWFIARVIPAPHRSQYPCQQVAIPIAFGYIAFWTAMIYGLFHWMQKVKTKTAAFTPVLLIIVLFISTMSGVGFAASYQTLDISYEPWTPLPKEPIGIGQGINPGRVVWVWDPDATEQELDGYWWYEQNNDQQVINTMISQGIQSLTDQPSDETAWNALFSSFNSKRNNEQKSYQPGEKIAIKVNLNNCYNPFDFIDDYQAKDNQRDAHPMVVKSLIYQLESVVGVNPSDITVYDVSRPMPDWFYDQIVADYPSVNYVDKKGDAPGRTKAEASDVSIHFSDGVIRTLPQCVVDADYLINMPILKQHPINHGVTLSGKNMFGTFIEPVIKLHPYHKSGQIMGNAAPQTDLLAHHEIGQKTLLFLGDGLYATLRDHRTITWFHMYPFNDDWTNSLFFSQDPVAIDSVMYDFLHTEGPIPIEGSQNYLHQAAEPLADTYDPEDDGTYLSQSLGVHEHWDTNESIFSSNRYSGPLQQGIDYKTVGQEHANQAIVITRPAEDSLYVFDQEQFIHVIYWDFYKYPTTMVVGPITINTTINSDSSDPIEKVVFSVDGTKKHTDETAPFQWQWNGLSLGRHQLEVTAWSNGEATLSAERMLYKIL
ncbi:MAG: DUF362 domain-containing protein [Thermoplasmatota archaeon]